MTSRFVSREDAAREEWPWGVHLWFSRPDLTGGRQLTIVEVELVPGEGHNFHRHPGQEEVLYVLGGEVEQWLERESRVLKAGDAVFIHKDIVHASFNSSGGPARFLAILGPSVGATGYETVDVSAEEPWSGLRS
jgi:quercetin dioxygenase-like cupin family protein